MPEFDASYRVIRRRGEPDVRSLEAYRRAGGYAALEKAVREQPPAQIIQQVLDAQLRGRGGAGRPTGEKWLIVRQQPDETRYVICNAYDADEHSLAARALLERNPHQVIEGIVLAAYAVGASEAYLFTRSLYLEGIASVQGITGSVRRKSRWTRYLRNRVQLHHQCCGRRYWLYGRGRNRADRHD